MKKLVLGGGALALVLGGGALLPGVADAVALGLFALAACLGVGALALGLFWKVPLPASHVATYPPAGTDEAEEMLRVPVLCYRSNGEVDYVLGELLPRPAR